MEKRTKDLVLLLKWLRSLLCHGFDPWSRNFHMYGRSTPHPPRRKKKKSDTIVNISPYSKERDSKLLPLAWFCTVPKLRIVFTLLKCCKNNKK